MKTLWKYVGTVAFWICWPLFRVYPAWGKRTRVLVICDTQIVAVKGWLATDTWKLPGGGLHKNEKPLLGAIRELQEETGLIVTPNQVQSLFSGTYRENGLKTDYECFAVELSKQTVLHPQRFELTEAVWLPINELTPDNAGQDISQALVVWQSMV